MASSSSACNVIISQNRNYVGSIIFNNKSVYLPSKVNLPGASNLTVCSVAKTTPVGPPLPVEFPIITPSTPNSSWSEFASKVSGEWDGFGADFTTEGKPIELPETVVPEAYREWEVKVFDWQTQCPTLADSQNLDLSYRSIKLLPTVGCEADAATIYSTDERNIGVGSDILAFAYQNTGCYVALWSVEENEAYNVFELEHCLIDPRDKESRVRVIQILRLERMKLTLKKIRVFCEQWYGPFRNGDQLGGCSIRDSAFASTAALNASDATGVWQSQVALASYQSPQNNTFQELVGGSSHVSIVRNEHDLITLPRKLWCSLNESENGETFGEVGWLMDHGFAISSRCIFSSDGKLKEIAVGHDTAGMN